MGSLRRGFGWNVLTQGVSITITLLMVPIVIGRLGLEAYGALTLAQSGASLLQTLDGGMLNTAARYLGISAGAKDRQDTADHFVTITLIVVTLACLFGVVLFVLAPSISSLFHMSRLLRKELIYAARIVSILLPVGLLAGVFEAVLTVNGQFRALALASASLMVGYAVAVLVFVGHRDGVDTMMQITLAQQILVLVVFFPWVFRYASPFRGRLLPWTRVRALLAYSTKIQLTTLANVVNVQTDALIVGAVLPVHYVGLYGVGANLASELRSVPLNLAGPLVARLSQTFGRSGSEATFREYARIQRIWVTAVGAFCLVVLGATVFQLEGWLGQRFVTAGFVSMLLQAGNLMALLTMPLATYLQIIGRPDLCLRYGLVAAAINLMLTIAFIWVGVYGIAGGTAAGLVIGSLGLLWLARRAVSPNIPNFLTPVPWLASLVGGGASALAGAGLLALANGHGPQDLILVSLSLIPGACAFALARLGFRRTYAVIVETASSRSLNPLIDALGLAAP